MIEKLLFYYKASNSKGHGVHSPFVFQIITEVLNDERHFYAYDEIEHLYQTALKNGEIVVVNGQKEMLDSYLKREVSLKYRKLLFRIVSYYKPSSILEIGATTGISTAYLASVNNDTKTIFLARDFVFLNSINEKLKQLNYCNTHIFINKESFLNEYIVGEDRGTELFVIHLEWEEAQSCLEQLVAVSKFDTIIVLLGINKNVTTKNVWTKIRNQTTITISIELFEMGLLFFRKEQLEKQHFAVRF